MNEQLIQVNNIIKTLLEQIGSIEIQSSNISQNEILQLIAITNFVEEFNGFEITSEVKNIANKISININNNYLDSLTTDMKILHLAYIVNVLININQVDEVRGNYFNLLSKFENLEDMGSNFVFITTLFTVEKLDRYYRDLAKYMFDDYFWSNTLEYKQSRIFVYYYYSGLFIKFGTYSRIMFDELYKVYQKALSNQDDNLIFYLHQPLNLSWNSLSQIQEDMQQFNSLIEKPLSDYIYDIMMPKYNLLENKKVYDSKKEKIKVAFIFHAILETSVDKVHYSLIKFLSENPDNKYEFIIINLNVKEIGCFRDKRFDDLSLKFQNLNFKYIDCHKEFDNEDISSFYDIVGRSIRLRQLIMDEEIDIVIGNNTRVEYNFLFSTRTAPKQLYWSHGNYIYDVKGIDSRFTHTLGVGIFEKFGYKYVGITDIIENSFLIQSIDENKIKEERKKYPMNAVILGTIGRLNKIASKEYIDTICDVMLKNQDVIYIACGNGDREYILSEVEKFGLQHRWYFPGYVDSHLYCGIIDIWPNTFPLPQGLSTLEFMSRSKPIVTLKNDTHDYNSQITVAQKYYQGLKYPMVALNIKIYKDSLELLINDAEVRISSGKYFKNYIDKNYLHYDTSSFISMLNE